MGGGEVVMRGMRQIIKYAMYFVGGIAVMTLMLGVPGMTCSFLLSPPSSDAAKAIILIPVGLLAVSALSLTIIVRIEAKEKKEAIEAFKAKKAIEASEMPAAKPAEHEPEAPFSMQDYLKRREEEKAAERTPTGRMKTAVKAILATAAFIALPVAALSGDWRLWALFGVLATLWFVVMTKLPDS